jgi:hypothetical protein
MYRQFIIGVADADGGFARISKKAFWINLKNIFDVNNIIVQRDTFCHCNTHVSDISNR